MKPAVDGLTDVLSGSPKDYADDDLEAPPAQRNYALFLTLAAALAPLVVWALFA